MKTTSIIALLTTLAVAAPSKKAIRQDISSRDAELCHGAPNCEVYDTPQGTRIRFVAGMEPGSTSYNTTFGPNASTKETTLNQRDDGINTHVTLGKSTFFYGTVVPSVAMKSLTSGCPATGACIPDPIRISTTTTNGGEYIDLIPEGQYANAAERDNFVAAISAAVVKGTQTSKESGCTMAEGTIPKRDCSTITVNKQTNWVSVSRYQGANLQGYMTVRVQQDPEDAKWCQAVMSVLSGIVGEVSSIGSGFFGAVATPACN